MITEYLHDDPRTLWTLLLVDHLFFHAAVSLLYADPFKLVRPENQYKLVTLILASFIHHQRRISQPFASSNPSLTAAELLFSYGLEPVHGNPLSPLLQDAILGVSSLTINYVQLLRVLFPWRETSSWNNSMLQTTLQLATPNVLTAVLDIPGNELEVSAATPFILEADVRARIWTRLDIMLLRSYPQNITSITFDVYESSWYICLADKLKTLRTVHLWRSRHGVDIHVTDTISFFAKHGAAFPGKRPVHIDFGPGWDIVRPFSFPAMTSTTQGERETWRRLQKPKIDLYKAVSSPIHIDARECPRFYEDIINDIKLDSLETLVDLYGDRFKFGETLYQQSFFRKCQNIKALNISVDYPEFFSWAVGQQDTSSSHRHRIDRPSKLQELRLCLQTDPVVLKDAMTAFGQSLQALTILTGPGACFFQSPEMVVFGNWSLPFVKMIDIDVPPKCISQIGDFGQCPRLEKLNLTLDTDPRSTLSWHHLDKSIRLIPLWKLPRLRTLNLKGIAAIFFNYDSLDHCRSLETLNLTTNYCDDQSVSSAGISHWSYRRGHSQVQDSNDLAASSPTKHPSRSHWGLPKLQTLVLKGSPSSAFRNNWLDKCPALEHLHLTSSNAFDTNVRLYPNDGLTLHSADSHIVQSGTSQVQPRIESKLKKIQIEGPWTLSEEGLGTLLTLYAPNVLELHVDRIENDPVPSELDLMSQGGWILGAILKGEYINGKRNQRISAGRAGTRITKSPIVSKGKLRYFSCSHNLPRDDKMRLGLRGIDNREVDRYRHAAKIVFCMSGQHYIQQSDKM